MNPELGFSEVLRDVAQLGSALRSGRRGRRFKSCHPDQNEKDRVRDTVLFVFRKGMTDLNLPYFSFTTPAQKQAIINTKSI